MKYFKYNITNITKISDEKEIDKIEIEKLFLIF